MIYKEEVKEISASLSIALPPTAHIKNIYIVKCISYLGNINMTVYFLDGFTDSSASVMVELANSCVKKNNIFFKQRNRNFN